jgi:hypothetical protein
MCIECGKRMHEILVLWRRKERMNEIIKEMKDERMKE